MPNTPALVLSAMSAISFDDLVTEEDKVCVQSIFNSFGKCEVVEETMMAALVNEVSKLLLAYNAVVILEDFSRGKRLLGGKSVPTFYMQFARNLFHSVCARQLIKYVTAFFFYF